MSLSGGRYHSFVVRILSREGEAIQGEITHVGTRKSVRFSDARRMVRFITENLKLPGDPELPEPAGEEPR